MGSTLDTNNKQCCPICKKDVQPSSRYPRYICAECIKSATDMKGKEVMFYNTSLSGHGCAALYRANRAKYESLICYINGIKCIAGEGYLGGIVIQPVEISIDL